MELLKTLNDLGIVEDEVLSRAVLKTELKQELAIKWIKKTELAKAWRIHQLSQNTGDIFWGRHKEPKPKEKMSEEEISYCLQFVGLTDSKLRNWIMRVFNLTEEDLR